MFFKNFAVVTLLVLTLCNFGQSEEVWDKIKHAYNVAYDEVHCGFHKVKETFQHHEHDHGNDPCKNKPSQSTTERNVNIYGVQPDQVEPLQPNNPNPTPPQNGQYANQYEWQQQ